MAADLTRSCSICLGPAAGARRDASLPRPDRAPRHAPGPRLCCGEQISCPCPGIPVRHATHACALTCLNFCTHHRRGIGSWPCCSGSARRGNDSSSDSGSIPMAPPHQRVLLLAARGAVACGSSGGCGGAPRPTSAAKGLSSRWRADSCWSSGSVGSGGVWWNGYVAVSQLDWWGEK